MSAEENLRDENVFPDKRNYTVFEIARMLEMEPEDFNELAKPARTRKEKQLQIDALKYRVKKQYRKIAMRHHPDHGGNADNFKILTRVYEAVNAIQVVENRPRPRVVVRFGGGGTTSATDTSTTTGSSGWSYFRF